MQSVLVAGASGAIGSAVVDEVRQRGWDALGVDRRPPADPTAFARVVTADLTDPATPPAAAAAAREHGALWGLVYCAGEYPLVDLDAYSGEVWERVHAVNVTAAFALAHALRDVVQRGGRMVFVASGAGHVGSRDPGYASSKAALLGLVRSLARTLAAREILVNAVTPGLVESGMSQRMPPERRRRHVEQTALGRAGRPEEVAVAVSFLLDPANTYVTGASIDVNGGLYAR
jgi:NAD(P)-dependent dehydrogenase (short-subunit alcohol dehydrogenase family)